MLSNLGVAIGKLNEMFHFLNIAAQRSHWAAGFLQVGGESWKTVGSRRRSIRVD